MLGFGPFCLDLGYLAESGSEGDKALRMGWGDKRTDGQTDQQTEGYISRVLQDFVPFAATALVPLNLHHTLLKQGTGTTDHLLPLGCYL